MTLKTGKFDPSEIAALRSAAPLDADKAATLGRELSRSPRSIISKAISLEIPYNKKQAVTASKRGTPKADLVAAIAKGLDTDTDSIAGLVKADARSLSNLLSAIA
jgi:hypothetical protein